MAFFSLLLRFLFVLFTFKVFRCSTVCFHFSCSSESKQNYREYNVREIYVSELLIWCSYERMSYAKWYKNYFIIGQMDTNEDDLKHLFPCISVSWYIAKKSSIRKERCILNKESRWFYVVSCLDTLFLLEGFENEQFSMCFLSIEFWI